MTNNNKICVVCKGVADIKHHISYIDDKTIDVCQKCHRKIHSKKTHKYYPKDKYWDRTDDDKCIPLTISIKPKLMCELNAVNPLNNPSQNVRVAIQTYLKYKRDTKKNLYQTIQQLTDTIQEYDKKINSIDYQKKYEELIDKILNKLKISIE